MIARWVVSWAFAFNDGNIDSVPPNFTAGFNRVSVARPFEVRQRQPSHGSSVHSKQRRIRLWIGPWPRVQRLEGGWDWWCEACGLQKSMGNRCRMEWTLEWSEFWMEVQPQHCQSLERGFPNRGHLLDGLWGLDVLHGQYQGHELQDANVQRWLPFPALGRWWRWRFWGWGRRIQRRGHVSQSECQEIEFFIEVQRIRCSSRSKIHTNSIKTYCNPQISADVCIGKLYSIVGAGQVLRMMKMTLSVDVVTFGSARQELEAKSSPATGWAWIGMGQCWWGKALYYNQVTLIRRSWTFLQCWMEPLTLGIPSMYLLAFGLLSSSLPPPCTCGSWMVAVTPLNWWGLR